MEKEAGKSVWIYDVLTRVNVKKSVRGQVYNNESLNPHVVPNLFLLQNTKDDIF